MPGNSGKKGKHGSKKPPIKTVQSWVKAKPEEIEKLVIELAKERKTPASIGLMLRDQHGIPDVKAATGKNISKIMKENDLYPKIPDDMISLLKKAVLIREHLQRHRKDKHSRRGLENLEAKIRRLGKYYSREGILPANWRYDPNEAKLIVQK